MTVCVCVCAFSLLPPPPSVFRFSYECWLARAYYDLTVLFYISVSVCLFECVWHFLFFFGGSDFFPVSSRENGVIFDDNELTSSFTIEEQVKGKWVCEGGMFLFRTAGIFRCSVLMYLCVCAS